VSCGAQLVSFPAHALLSFEERPKEQEAEGVRMSEGIERDELALQILLMAALTSHPATGKARP
jgi:hypothetical protein